MNMRRCIIQREPERSQEERFDHCVLKELTNDDGHQNNCPLSRNHADIVADAVCADDAMCSLTHEERIARSVHGWLVRRIGRDAAGSFEHPACLELEEQLHSLYGAVFDGFVAFVAGILEAKPLRRSDVPVVLVSKLARSYQIASGVRRRVLDEGNPVAFHRWGVHDIERNRSGRVLSDPISCVSLSHSSQLVMERMREVQRRSAVDALALRVFTMFAVRPAEKRRALDPTMLRSHLAPFFLILDK